MIFITKRSDFRIEHWGEDMFKIKCNAVWYNVEKRTETDAECEYSPLPYRSLATLRVDLFSFLNKTYGTAYEITDEMIAEASSYRGKKECVYSNAYEDGWEFNIYGGFYHNYHYEDIPNCSETFGDGWKKESFIAFADTIDEFFKKDPLTIVKSSTMAHNL